jgi:hypothetical protein
MATKGNVWLLSEPTNFHAWVCGLSQNQQEVLRLIKSGAKLSPDQQMVPYSMQAPYVAWFLERMA